MKDFLVAPHAKSMEENAGDGRTINIYRLCSTLNKFADKAVVYLHAQLHTRTALW